MQTKPALKNVDFCLGEDTSIDSAPWLRAAVSENLVYQSEMNQLTGRVGEIQPAGDGEDGKEKNEEGFKWIQSSEEVELRIPVDASRTANIRVQFKSSSVVVFVLKEKVAQISLYGRIDPDGCTWTLDTDEHQTNVVVSCEKIEPVSWPRIQI